MIGRSMKRPNRAPRDAEQLIQSVLEAANRPLSAYDIRDAAADARERISIPQVYRVVTRLAALGRIRRVETLNAYMIGSSASDAVGICRTCATTISVPIGDLPQQIKDLMGLHGFAAEDIIVEVQGHCSSCLAQAGQAGTASSSRRTH